MEIIDEEYNDCPDIIQSIKEEPFDRDSNPNLHGPTMKKIKLEEGDDCLLDDTWIKDTDNEVSKPKLT